MNETSHWVAALSIGAIILLWGIGAAFRGHVL